MGTGMTARATSVMMLQLVLTRPKAIMVLNEAHLATMVVSQLPEMGLQLTKKKRKATNS